MTVDLRDLLAERIEGAPAPAGDLAAVTSAGRRIRNRRRVATGAVVAAAVVAVGGAVVTVDGDSGPGGDAATDRSEYSSLGALDFSAGIRAYGDPGNFVSIGGRRVPAKDLEWLDTDAVATSYGIVFYAAGRPMLLDESGDYARLVDGPVDRAPAFHPTAKAEADEPVVVWATMRGGQTTITVHDLAAGEDVASVQGDCGRCSDLVLDGLDRGVVFVRTPSGTRTWDSATGEWADFAGPETRVADVRNGVVLYDGPAPTDPGGWRLVPGAVDAQLTFDGGHVLHWSSTLAPTAADGEPIVLEEGPADGRGYGQWTIDSDGSVLVITAGHGGEDLVYDCVLPTGDCVAIDSFVATGGDPLFMGNDM